jgi:hypothetical protein
VNLLDLGDNKKTKPFKVSEGQGRIEFIQLDKSGQRMLLAGSKALMILKDADGSHLKTIDGIAKPAHLVVGDQPDDESER